LEAFNIILIFFWHEPVFNWLLIGGIFTKIENKDEMINICVMFFRRGCEGVYNIDEI
jgi:hypothetical protein